MSEAELDKYLDKKVVVTFHCIYMPRLEGELKKCENDPTYYALKGEPLSPCFQAAIVARVDILPEYKF